MSELKLYLFGPPRLEQAGQALTVGRRKGMALLAYLAITDQPHSRDALATLFWPDVTRRLARGSLSQSLSELTKTLGNTRFLIEPDQIALASSADLWLDITQFRTHLAAVEKHDHESETVLCSACLTKLHSAVDLYQADFLAGFTLRGTSEFDEWQFFETDSLRREFGGLLERLIAYYQSVSDYEQAITYARRWLAQDSMHEPAHQNLMRLYAQSGQQAAALRQYDECIRILDEELGVSPEEETTALYEVIRTRRFPDETNRPDDHTTLELDTAPSLALASETKRPEPPVERHFEETFSTEATERPLFVGRQQELAWLERQLNTTLAGQAQIVFITGEAGQGKTALIHAFAQSVQKQYPSLVVVKGTCNAYTGLGDPYSPFRSILEQLTGDLTGHENNLSPEQRKTLQQIITVMGQALVEIGSDLLNTFVDAQQLLNRLTKFASPNTPWLAELQKRVTDLNGGGQPGIQQGGLFEQFTKVFQRLSSYTPLLIILDDMQWVDSASANLVLHLSRRLTTYPIFVINTYRPNDVAMGRNGERHPLEQVLHECQRIFGNVTLDLSQAENQAFMNELLNAEPNALDDAFRDTLFRQTNGHPLFTLELLQDMKERGDLVQNEAGQWITQPQLDWGGLPARVEGAIGERISRLSSPTQALLQLASLEGEEFTAEVLSTILDIDLRQMIRHLSQDLDKTHRLVQAVGFRAGDSGRLSRYRFRHNLIQRYLYDTQDEVERVYYHEDVGRTLEDLYGARAPEFAAELAIHFVEGQNFSTAIHYLQLAAEQALQRGAHREAIVHLSQGLEILGMQPDLPERNACELTFQAALAPALIATRGWADHAVEQAYRRACELGEQLGDVRQLATVLYGLATMHELRGEYGDTQRVLKERTTLSLDIEDTGIFVEAHELTACSKFHQGAFTEALDHADRVWQLYDRHHHLALTAFLGENPGVASRQWAGLSLWFLGHPDQAVTHIEQALRLARDIDHSFSLAHAQEQAAMLYQLRREPQQVQERASSTITLATEQGYPYRIGTGNILHGWAIAAQGHHEVGIRQIREGLAICLSTGAKIDHPYFLALLADACNQAGQVDIGLEAIAEALDLVAHSRMFFYEAELYRLKGELLLQKTTSDRQANAVVPPKTCLLKALEISHQQGTRSLALRATISLIRLWEAQGSLPEITDAQQNWLIFIASSRKGLIPLIYEKPKLGSRPSRGRPKIKRRATNDK